MGLPSAAVSSIIGLTVDTVGALLLAFDLWRPHAVEQPAGPSPEVLLIQVIKACESPEAVRTQALERTREVVSNCGKERAAREAQGGSALRRTGRCGLVLICLGFIGQLAGTILSASSFVQTPGVAVAPKVSPKSNVTPTSPPSNTTLQATGQH
jgi:hypothetical protein